MQFDGIAMRACLRELERTATGGRVQRVKQVSETALAIELYAGRPVSLVVSAEPEAACIFSASSTPAGGPPPTAFCGSLRHRLAGTRLVSASQQEWDRVAKLTFAGRNELGDSQEICLYVEIMGKHSNVVAVRSDGRILDAQKHVGRSRSRVRQILPGLLYSAPPPQAKAPPLDLTARQILEMWSAMDGAPQAAPGVEPGRRRRRELAAALVAGISGLGPDRALSVLEQAAAKLGWHAAGPLAAGVTESIAAQAEAADSGSSDEAARAEAAFALALAGSREPGTGGGTAGRPQRPEAADLRAAVTNARNRVHAQLAAARIQLAGLAEPEWQLTHGDAILASLSTAREAVEQARNDGRTTARLVVPARTAESAGLAGGTAQWNDSLELELDVNEDPARAAQRLYSGYGEAKRGKAALCGLIARQETALQHLDNLQFQIEQELTPDELAEIRAEAESAGLIAAAKTGKRLPPRASPPRTYRSPSGFEILVGRNNKQNESLLRLGHGDDVWLHARGVAGAHVLLRRAGRPGEVPQADLEYAASLAAQHSQARDAASAAVDACPLRRVRREKGAPPGHVTYSGERTLRVSIQPAQPG